jgi:hypothetical protein
MINASIYASASIEKNKHQFFFTVPDRAPARLPGRFTKKGNPKAPFFKKNICEESGLG